MLTLSSQKIYKILLKFEFRPGICPKTAKLWDWRFSQNDSDFLSALPLEVRHRQDHLPVSKAEL